MGSGKTTVADELARLGAFVIRADSLARQVLTPQYDRFLEILSQLDDSFGAANFMDGEILNRASLAKLAFKERESVEALNKIMHPHVARLFEREAAEAKGVAVYDVPLLFEAGLNKKVKKTIVVYAPEEVAIERAAKRLNISKSQAKERLKYQICIEKKKKLADYVIDNSASLGELIEETEKLYNKLLRYE